ncbi:C-reactive protein-like [Protobothrops mucrosquamatus]|uniref:C-reactive protein-like n=1 Tax=Protobothrops mucrosquamatus TaxID=103944 RepID=UPI000775EB6B|nr:C-reactive protein-like [Protobothrops mucrosquamatus]
MAKSDLQKKVFIFPAANKKAAVYLNVSFPEPLTNFTVCLRYSPLQFRSYTLLSYSTKHKSKDFQIVKPNSHTYNLIVGGLSQIIGPLKQLDAEWQHVCVAWNSTSGVVHCWLNGERLPRFVMRKGYKMGQNGTLFLGHGLDSWGKKECFLGEMADVNLWLRVLTDEEVNSVKKNDDVPNAWLRWRAFNYTAQGGACVEEALHHVS